MDKNEIKRRAEIMLAFVAGKTVQLRLRNGLTDKWSDGRDVIFDWYSFDYRIKPEPEVVYVNLYPKECPSRLGMAYPTRREADENAGSTRIRCMKMVEVLDD